MKRRIIMVLLVLISFFIQSAVFPAIAIGSIKPNLLLVLTVSFALMRGRGEGMFVGFFCGILTDLFYGSLLGVHALIYVLIGYINGHCYRIFYDDDIKMPVVLSIASDFSYGIVIYLFQFLLRGRISFPFYLGRIIIPEIIYTALLTLVIYRILFKLNRKLERSEQRGVNSFV